MSARRRGHRDAPSRDWLVWVICGVVVLAAALVAFLVVPQLTEEDVDPAQAADLYERHCGTCHGLEGQGNIGPQLAGGAVVDAYPDIDDQIAVITDGRGEMPPFGHVLSDAEIRAVAEHTRAL